MCRIVQDVVILRFYFCYQKYYGTINFCRMSQDVGKLRCRIAQVPLYLHKNQLQYTLTLYSSTNVYNYSHVLSLLKYISILLWRHVLASKRKQKYKIVPHSSSPEKVFFHHSLCLILCINMEWQFQYLVENVCIAIIRNIVNQATVLTISLHEFPIRKTSCTFYTVLTNV